MRVFHGFDALPRFACPAVTIGSYDGVHLGHRALLRSLIAAARHSGGESVVMTFEPHPRITLGRAEGLYLLTSLGEKLRLLEQAGVDNTIVVAFDGHFSRLSGREFLRDYVIGRVGARTLIVGYDHRFGHDRVDGEAARELGLRVETVDECQPDGRHVSSTEIRRLIRQGAIAEAESLLGHPIELKQIQNWKL